MYGKTHTEEARQKIREAKLGKIVLVEVRQKIAKTRIEKGLAKGENNPMYGRIHTEESRQKIRNARKNQIMKTGELHSNWQNGKSFEIYPKEFKLIKKQILKRDEYKCQYPNCKEDHKRLHVHHIDFNKQNNNPENLITLGASCHARTYGKKSIYWIEFYQNIMMGKITERLL